MLVICTAGISCRFQRARGQLGAQTGLIVISVVDLFLYFGLRRRKGNVF
jgi:hypothetical protein